MSAPKWEDNPRNFAKSSEQIEDLSGNSNITGSL
jgi:hypothetical protein